MFKYCKSILIGKSLKIYIKKCFLKILPLDNKIPMGY